MAKKPSSWPVTGLRSEGSLKDLKDSKLILNESVWYRSEPLEGPYSSTSCWSGTIFCCFLQQSGFRIISNWQKYTESSIRGEGQSNLKQFQIAGSKMYSNTKNCSRFEDWSRTVKSMSLAVLNQIAIFDSEFCSCTYLKLDTYRPYNTLVIRRRGGGRGQKLVKI